MFKTTRLQHASLFFHQTQVDQYVLHINSAQVLPLGLPSIQGAINYVTNVNLDGLGPWMVVGSREKDVLLQRTIHEVETRQVHLRMGVEYNPEYGLETKEGVIRVSDWDFRGANDKPAHALKTAIMALSAEGWALDSVIDPWKAPPAQFQVWRPQHGRVTR